MKSFLGMFLMIACVQLSAVAAFAQNDTREEVLAKERTRLETMTQELAAKRNQVIEVKRQVVETQNSLEKYRTESTLGSKIAVPSIITLTLAMGLHAFCFNEARFLCASGSKLALTTTGITGATVGTTIILMNMHDISHFNKELRALEEEIDRKLAAIDKDKFKIATAKHSICILEEKRPADCEAAFQAEVEAL